jgi:metallo-beta-lactamase class B
MTKPNRQKFFAILTLLIIPSITQAQASSKWRAWNQPVKPFRLIGNIYYVGANEVTSYLITTPEGHILLDSGFAETVPIIQENLNQLGFKLEDVKILINSHAHTDHAGGLARLKELTKATLIVSRADGELLADGARNDFAFGDKFAFQAVKADRFIKDKEAVTLGGVSLIPRLTPGHTKGCTTWTMKVEEGGKAYDVVFLGSVTAPDYQLVNNAKYPNIVADYEATFSLLRSLPCDVFLAPHGQFFGLTKKRQRLQQTTAPNPFINPQEFRTFVTIAERTFQRLLARQQRTK